MENKELRRADFITSVILMLFGLWILSQALQMPLKDTYGGVRSVWYVSPALLPLFLSGIIFLFGIILLIHSIKTGGSSYFIETIKKIDFNLAKMPESTMRFIAILTAFLSFVYLNIPRVDFFLSAMLFLVYFISVFYFDNINLMKKLTVFYLIWTLLFIVFYATKISKILNNAFVYSMDVLALLFIIAYIIYTFILIRSDKELIKKFRITLIVVILVPLIICPIFKFQLLVLMPKEGGIIDLMSLIFYSIKDALAK